MKQLTLLALVFWGAATATAQDFFSNEAAETTPFFFENWQATEPDTRQDFIEKWKSTAQKEFARAGVPASIKMAQAILESNAGQSELAREAKNHFGIKCASEWRGKTYFLTDDEKDASGSAIKSCFRKYKDAEDSWIDHSDFLRDPKKYNRYGFLFHLDPKDYRAWAYGLKSAGYATAPSYAESLISVIEAHKLYELDRGGSTAGGSTKPGPGGATTGGAVEGNVQPGRGIGRVNDVKIVLTKKGERLDDVSKRTRVPVSKLLDFNDDRYEPTQPLPEGTRIFIQKKRNRWRGRQKEHYVRDNQLLVDVAQQYGIKLSKLLKKNRLQAGEEPATGETVKVRGFFPRLSKPRLRSGDQIADLQKTPPTDRPSQPNSSRPTSGGMVTPGSNSGGGSTRPGGSDEELPFDVSNGRIEDRPGAGQPSGGNGSGSTATQPTRPPIETSGSDRPSGDRAQPSGGNGSGSTATQPTAPPTSRPTGSDMVRPSGGSSQPTAQPAPAPQPDRVAGATYHTVAKGDTLYNMSKKYGTTPAAIRQLNGMADDNIKIGVTYRVR